MSLAQLLSLGKSNEPEKPKAPAKVRETTPEQLSSSPSIFLTEEDKRIARELIDKQEAALRDEMAFREAEEEAEKAQALEKASAAAVELARKQRASAAQGNPFVSGGRVYQPGVFVCDMISGSKPAGAKSIIGGQTQLPVAFMTGMQQPQFRQFQYPPPSAQLNIPTLVPSSMRERSRSPHRGDWGPADDGYGGAAASNNSWNEGGYAEDGWNETGYSASSYGSAADSGYGAGYGPGAGGGYGAKGGYGAEGGYGADSGYGAKGSAWGEGGYGAQSSGYSDGYGAGYGAGPASASGYGYGGKGQPAYGGGGYGMR